MFEGVVAGVVNRFLGKYVQDLDTENLNVGIFSGNVNLSDLKLKPEALFELNLPIDVKIGTIGKISFQIPWSGIYTQPIIVNIEDVLILSGPAISNHSFDANREKRLIRAAKKKIIEDLESESNLYLGPKNFIEKLFTTFVNNIQIRVKNFHLRYEDSTSSKDGPMACGICLQSLSIETTNSKWKPALTPQVSNTVYQMLKLESLSIYWNSMSTVLDDEEAINITPLQYYNWKQYMMHGLDKFTMHGEEFEFIMKPVTCKVKVIINRSSESRVPRLLVDSVIQDSVVEISRRQYKSIINLVESFNRIEINRKYRHYHPYVPVLKNERKWWLYAYNSVLEQRVKPYTWQEIKKHRDHYKHYKNAYKRTIKSPKDTELKLDLQQCEDLLPISSIIVAREHAKIELLAEESDLVEVGEHTLEYLKPYYTGDMSPIEDLTFSHISVKYSKENTVWGRLTSPEKKKICELIGFVEGEFKYEKRKQFIEHKLNLTLANFSLSLINHGKEIMVIGLTQLLLSLETRPSSNAFKISARAENIVIEGINTDNDLIVLLSCDNINQESINSNNVLAIDFEKKPLNCEAVFGINLILTPIEMVYNEHSFKELLSFFQPYATSSEEFVGIMNSGLNKIRHYSIIVIQCLIDRTQLININVDLKGPYLIIPESGCTQKSGNSLIVDFGRITVKSELQLSDIALEDATCMELEEKLYDRLHLDCNGIQVLFCDSGESWREMKKLSDSEIHLLTKMRLQVIFSNSIKKIYKLLPRYKLNIMMSCFKLNVSERVIIRILDFIMNIPFQFSNTIPLEESHTIDMMFINDKIYEGYSFKKLLHIKRKIVGYYLRRSSSNLTTDNEGARAGLLERDFTQLSSEYSDEEMELYARSVDLPGFDDNVSPNNYINILLRFVIGEVVLNISRSMESNERPYLMLRAAKLCLEMAMMEYGPALQISVNSFLLCDKQQQSTSGEYLEIFKATEFLNVLYRKVKANCPDFKTHFHSVEQSLVVDVGEINLNINGDALGTLIKYLQYLWQKVKIHPVLSWLESVKLKYKCLNYCKMDDSTDPPVPPGATKFSYSIRLSQIKAKVSHLDCDLIMIKLNVFESDCVFKANDRLIFKAFLNNINVEDLSESTLYPKLLWIEEDKVFELKYVRHAPRHNKNISGNELTQDNVKYDGSFKLYLGRCHGVVLYKVIIDLQQFFESLIWHTDILDSFKSWKSRIKNIMVCLKEAHLMLAVEIHAPILLLPHKADSPNLIVFNMGDFLVENFFKDLTTNINNTVGAIINNILIKLVNVTFCRAVVSLTGTLEVQEPILEPLSLKVDLKQLMKHGQIQIIGPKEILNYDIICLVDTIIVNLGHKDLTTILAVWNDNFCEAQFMGISHNADCTAEKTDEEDQSVKNLEAFITQGKPIKKEISLIFTLDGIELKLFSDLDEVLSSPVRDMSKGLAKLTAGELSLHCDRYNDCSVDMKCSLQNMLVEDIRPVPSLLIKRIFQSHGGRHTVDSSISVSTPPIMDISLKQNPSFDIKLDVLVEKTRLNFSVPFFINLARFVSDALPGEISNSGGIVNPGYIGESTPARRATGSLSSIGGYCYTGTPIVENSPGLSISIQFRKPEIMFFTALTKTESYALLLRSELLIDYSQHSNRSDFVISLAGLQVLSKLQSKLQNLQPQIVLNPCDIEFVKTFRNNEDGLKISLTISPIEMHLAATTIHTLKDISSEINQELSPIEEKEYFAFTNCNAKIDKHENEDLWSPKKIVTYHTSNADETYCQSKFTHIKIIESFNASVPNVKIIFEMEKKTRIPVVILKMSAELSLNEWSRQIQGLGEINLQAVCYNDKNDNWEPLIEPILENENYSRPWELMFKIFQAKSYQMSNKRDNSVTLDKDLINDSENSRSKKSKKEIDSEVSGDELDSFENKMLLIKSPIVKLARTRNDERQFGNCEGDDSDSEPDKQLMDKLTNAISHLFTDASSSEENSEESSGAEQSETDNVTDLETNLKQSAITKKSFTKTTLIERKSVSVQEPIRADSIDSGLEESFLEKMALYVIASAKDEFNLTLTSHTLDVLNNLLNGFLYKTDAITEYIIGSEGGLTLINDVGPGCRVELVTNRECTIAGKDRILCTSDYDIPDESRPTTPVEHIQDEMTDVFDEWDCFEGGFTTDLNTPLPTPKISPTTLALPPDPVAELYGRVTEERLIIKQHDFKDLIVVCPKRSVNKTHVLRPSRNSTRYYLVVTTDCSYKNRTIIVRSPLQIHNETSYTLELFYKKTDLEAIGTELLGELTNPFDDKMRLKSIAPDQVYNVPLYIAYHCKLFLMPANFDTFKTASGLWWKTLSSDLNQPIDIICPAKNDDNNNIFAMRVLAVEGVRTNKTNSSIIPNYLIRILPPLVLHNRLPYAINIEIETIDKKITIEPGEKTYCYNIDLTKIHRLKFGVNYFGLPWVGYLNLKSELTRKSVNMNTDNDMDGRNKSFKLCVKIDRFESWEMYFYVAYWIVNKTSLPLQIKASRSDTIYDFKDESLVCAGDEIRRWRVRAYSGAWSMPLPHTSLRAPLSTALLTCVNEERRRLYRMLLQVKFSELSPNLTRIITILPYFLVYNDTKRHLRFMEENEAADLWIDLQPGQCISFWPETDSMFMICKYRDTNQLSQRFSITIKQFTVLRMDKGSAICVDITGGVDKPFTIVFKPYNTGDAPIRIDNLCNDLYVKLQQKDMSKIVLVSPNQSLLYTWDEPSKDRDLVWNIYNHREKGFLAKYTLDGYGEEKISFHKTKQRPLTATNSVTSKLSSTFKMLSPKSPEANTSSSDSEFETIEKPVKPKKLKKDKVIIYWVSYMDNHQRVFVLTQDIKVAQLYRMKLIPELCNYEFYLSLSSVGISLCTNGYYGTQEVAYISLSDSIPKWELNISHKWKQLSLDLSTWIEDAYKSELKKCQLKEYIYIDFEKMHMTKPFFSELRRTYSPAVWLQFRKSDNVKFLNFKIHKLQIDNQMKDAVYPCVLYPHTREIIRRGYVKSCMEFIVLQEKKIVLNQSNWKYLKVIIQPFKVNLDRDFVGRVLSLFEKFKEQDKLALKLRTDLAVVHMSLQNLNKETCPDIYKGVCFEKVHLSPIKFEINLSYGGYNNEGLDEMNINKCHSKVRLFNNDLLDYTFDSWGSSLSDVKDVTIRLAYFELTNVYMSENCFIKTVIEHYWNELLQQFYLNILGVDILGNPFSLHSKLINGVPQYYYEPHLAQTENSEEIEYKLCFGVRSLLGHYVCGFPKAGSVFAQAIADCSMDLHLTEEFRRKYKYGGTSLQMCNDIPETLVQATRSYNITLPILLNGLISRPSLEDDCTALMSIYRDVIALSKYCEFSNPMDVIRVALSRNSQGVIARKRLTRHCHFYEGVQAYSMYNSLGQQMSTQEFIAHIFIPPKYNNVLLLTRRYITMMRCLNQVGDSWRSDWRVLLDDLIGVPTRQDDKLIISFRQDESVNYFSSDEKIVECSENELLDWLQAKIESTLIWSMEDKHCPEKL